MSLGSSARGSHNQQDPFSTAGTLDTPGHGFNRYMGMTSEYDPLLLNSKFYRNKLDSSHGPVSFRMASKDTHFAQLPHPDSDSQYQDLSDLESIEALVAPHGQKLLDLYFRVADPAYPILNKEAFLQSCSTRRWVVSPSLLAAMYLQAISWWSFSPDLNHLQQPDVGHLENIAYRTLLGSMQRPQLSTVQAGLLLLQRSNREPPWPLTAQLVAIGQELGLHVDCSEWNIPEWEKGLRKRLAWALFVQDVWSASTMGRPRRLTDSNWGVKSIGEADFPDGDIDENGDDQAVDVSNGRNVFLFMISLSQMLAEVLETLYSQSAESKVGQSSRTAATQAILSIAKPIQLRLRSWHGILTSTLPLDSVTPGRLSAIGSLHLCYFATEITLHRRIIRSLSPDTNENLVDIVRSAAKARLISSLDFFNRLRPEHLQGLWYFGSSVNFAIIGTFGCLLMKTSDSRHEASFYEQRLQEYRWTLGVSGQRAIAGLLDVACDLLDNSMGEAVEQAS